MTEQTLTSAEVLQQHIQAYAEALNLKQFGHTRMSDVELQRAIADAEQRRQALPLPLRAELEAAVLAELEAATAEIDRLTAAWPALRLAEMQAHIEQESTQIKILYAKSHAEKLGLNRKQLNIELNEKKAASSAAYNARTGNENQRAHIEQDIKNRFGWWDDMRNLQIEQNWRDPARWPEIARRVIAAIADDLYESRKQSIINNKLAELLAGNGHANGGA